MKNTSDEKILEEANLWINANHKVALATVIKTWGSSPRQVGSKMIVNEKGEFSGSISGGCVESSIIEESLKLLKDNKPFKKIEFKVTNQNAWEVGLACGVEITISATDGSLSYANILPATSGVYTAFYNIGRIGPTANNILGGSAYSLTASNRGTGGAMAYGPVVNMTTGKFSSYAIYGNQGDNGYPYNGGGNLMSIRHRKKYIFYTYNGTTYGNTTFDEDEVHAWLDEMAVHHGVL